MKRILFLTGIMAAGISLMAQERELRSIEQIVMQSRTSYPISGCQVPQLRRGEEKIANYVRQHPEAARQQQLQKRTAWNFTEGSKGPINGTSWWATDLTTESGIAEYQVPSTCRAVGNNCYIFVEDTQWNSGRVNKAAVDSIRNNWDLRTPAFPNKGIFEVDTTTFGVPKNVDNDPKIIILILDIRDGYSGFGGYVAGYFYSANEFSDNVTFPQGVRSNFAEIYYVDANPTDLRTIGGVTLGMQTAAHEFQHMIHYNYDQSEITFMNEGCSMVAELVNGYPYPDQNLYTNNTDNWLFNWYNSLEDYSRCQRWMLYMWNQFPNGYLKLLVQNTGTGIEGMDNALAQYTLTTTRRFNDIFVDWLVANQLQDVTVNPPPRYGYTYAGSLTKPTALSFLNPNTGLHSALINSLAADYLTFTTGSNLGITFTASTPFIKVKAVKIGPTAKQVDDVPIGTSYSVPTFGSTFTSITFVVINTRPDQPGFSESSAQYSYQATGTVSNVTIELKWDEAEPVGRLPLAPSDSLCVLFDAVSGARLDSIRVALRFARTMNGGVFAFSGVTRPSPFGAKLAFPISVSSNFSTPVTNPGSLYPYPVPYPNWRSLDLRSYNIQTNQPFAVGFWMSADTSKDAYVMVTEYSTGEFYHSLTFSTGSDGITRDWFYFTDRNTSLTFLWLIRAYVSIGSTTGVRQVIELQPKSFSLQQNFPNPFNPNTTIRYDVPEKSRVRLQVVDMLGRVVATLVDQEQLAGSYQSIWNGNIASGVPAPTGVYFYRLESGNYRAIKKMVMLK